VIKECVDARIQLNNKQWRRNRKFMNLSNLVICKTDQN